MEGRPEYVRCVLLGTYRDDRLETKTWCGRDTGNAEWAFQDAGHASLTARNGGRQMICAGCSEAIVGAIRGHTWGGE
jgi:hypothetical protein